MQIINEGLARIKASKADIVSKDMGVFYNPVMSFNRDISVILLNSIENKNMQIADPLAATGIRSIRFLKELLKGKIKSVSINDKEKSSTDLIKDNLKLNKIKQSRKISINNEDANIFMLNSNGFDYIDIDPFGSPNQFLDSAIRRISRNGILAVTATDTSALCGSFINACKRKYWAVPRNDALAHETGLRILARKVQLIGMQYEKSLMPVFSYSKDHYMRIFFHAEKGKERADEIAKLHGMFNEAGPMWLGQLWDKSLCSRMLKNTKKNSIFSADKELLKFLGIISDESKIASVGFYDVHDLCSRHRIRNMPTNEALIGKIMKKGYAACQTHFKGHGIRSDIPMDGLLKLIK
jgi:tRNA (guanine26-N2/guanine27-N2)-dimethyltransferase